MAHWNFIPWIPQLMSRFRFDEPHLLDKLLIRLAQTYPQAIFYAFKSAYTHYRRNGMLPNRPAVLEILDAIENTSLERFVSSVNCMVLPEKIVEQAFQKILANLSDDYEQEEYVDALQKCHDEVFRNALRSEIPKQYDSIKAMFGALLKLNGKSVHPFYMQSNNKNQLYLRCFRSR